MRGGVDSPDVICGKEIKPIDNVQIDDSDVVLLAAKLPVRTEILNECQKRNIKNFIEIDFFDSEMHFSFDYLSNEDYKNIIQCKWRATKNRNDIINFDNPTTFNDKIYYIKLNDKNPLKTELTDKYLVRKYIKDKIGEKYLVPLYGVWGRRKNWRRIFDTAFRCVG